MRPPPAADQAANNDTFKRSYAQVISSPRTMNTDWFSLKPIPFISQSTTYVNNLPTCIISTMELEQAEEQFQYALILRFSAGRPSLFDIKNHIYDNWGLSTDPVVTLLDARHVLLIAENQDDMIRSQTQPSHRINASLYRIFNWSRDFDYSTDSTIVPVWVSLPRLPISYKNPTLMRKIGTFLRVDDKTIKLNNALVARMCVELDVSKELPQGVWC
ncbi:hypothetical protein CASFOL_012344 [Castilleja foliolosa]|uniref:DUF4283 domain-containing protein n=1 Tax=Castilleja foliolosa TaxID=1961234 RepID=A0ABD3DQP8_9LAMI